MRPNFDDPDPKFLGLEVGVVVNRNDPVGLGRVRVRIPGLVEPASAWAYPLGAPGGGDRDKGTWWIPNEGAEVAVFFKRGDPDHPYYFTGNWGDPGGSNEVPVAAQVGGKGDPDIIVLALKEYDLVIDTRNGSKKFRIVDKASSENVIEFDGVARTLQISATTAIQIQSSGTVDIQGLVVSINGIVAGAGQL